MAFAPIVPFQLNQIEVGKPVIKFLRIACMAVLVLATSIAAQDKIGKVAVELEAGKYEGITGSMVSVDGTMLFEAYAPGYGADKTHDIRSATKSITALLIGELIKEGSLKGEKVKLSSLLPGEFAHMQKNDLRRNISIKDALTMRTGLACNDWALASVGHEDKMYKTQDWAAFLLSQPLAYERGKHFSYCTGGVVLLGRVIQNLSGMTVPAFADQRLFAPLGITGARWEETPTGYTDTGGHLWLTLRDLHKLGQLVLANGMWQGTQIIDAGWLKKATNEQTNIPERREKYGYLWWRDSREVKGTQVTLLYAHGNGGNFIFVVPELKLVASFTGKNYGQRTQFIPTQLVAQKIVPALITDPN